MSESNLLCPECLTPFTKQQENKLISYGVEKCRGCRTACCIENADVRLAMDCQQFMKKKNVREAYWYHISEDSGLDRGLRPELPIHIGTPATVRSYREMRFKHTDKFIYKFRIKPGAVIASPLADDVNWWKNEVARMDSGEYDVIRYINKWEGVGQISLLCNPGVLELVQKTKNRIL